MPAENRFTWGLLPGSVLLGLMLGYAGAVCCEQAASRRQPARQPSSQTAEQPAKCAPVAAKAKTAGSAAAKAKTAGKAAANGAANDGIVFPPNQVVLLKGSFDVICRLDEGTLEVDGKTYEWDAYQPPVLAAHVRLAPGLHQLRIGKRQREFVVAMNEEEHDGPEAWPHHQFHPIESDEEGCADCHDAKKTGGRLVVGKLKDHKACFTCHPPVEFEEIHSHPLEPIENCQDCHALHGSSHQGLLKAPVKKLCAKCHDEQELASFPSLKSAEK